MLPIVYDFITLYGLDIVPNDESETNTTKFKWELLRTGCKITKNGTSFIDWKGVKLEWSSPKIGKLVPNCLFCDLKRQQKTGLAIACSTDTKLFQTTIEQILEELQRDKKLSLLTLIG